MSETGMDSGIDGRREGGDGVWSRLMEKVKSLGREEQPPTEVELKKLIENTEKYEGVLIVTEGFALEVDQDKTQHDNVVLMPVGRVSVPMILTETERRWTYQLSTQLPTQDKGETPPSLKMVITSNTEVLINPEVPSRYEGWIVKEESERGTSMYFDARVVEPDESK